MNKKLWEDGGQKLGKINAKEGIGLENDCNIYSMNTDREEKQRSIKNEETNLTLILLLVSCINTSIKQKLTFQSGYFKQINLSLIHI